MQVEIDDERSESRVEEHDHLIHPVIAVLARQLIWSASQRPQRIHHESSYPHVVQPLICVSNTTTPYVLTLYL